MKKIKKLIVAISLFCLNFMAFSALFKPEATASIKRFDVDGLEEVMSAKTDELTVFGSYFWYGGIQMKSYLYQKYDSKNDIMYYFVFTDTGINGRGYKYHKPNWFKTEHHYFNSKKCI